MSQPTPTTWREILDAVKAQHPNLWRQWFESVEPVGLDSGLLRLCAASEVHQRYLQRECVAAFTDAAQQVTDRLVSVRFEVAREQARAPEPGDTPYVSVREDPPNGVAHHHGAVAPILIPDYTFDSFIIGPSNRLAHAAAVAVSKAPGRAYNPMFVHGGVGLGKTHLLQAVCQRVLELAPDASILYTSCEAFASRFMDAVQRGHMNEFRHEFRDVDLLVIDDIHFLARLERSQDEFFHTFNELHQNGRQIILSSDAPPDAIPELEDRLVSRFKWGLVAHMEKPDYETRVEIVKQKARARGVKLPEEVASMIAARFDSNIRELEGALTSVQMEAKLDAGAVTLDIAKRALGEPEPTLPPRVTIETIVKAVTDFYNVTLSSLQSRRKPRSIALPRQVCMYLARQYTPYSLEEIGGYFGGRDHTTVLHAEQKISALRDVDPHLKRAISELERVILRPEGGQSAA